MTFTETKLQGTFIIEPEKIEDERGFFGRTWCAKEFESRGLKSILVQCNISFNKNRGTLRGMHSQLPPYEETKLVRCTMGTICDVILDLRPESQTFKQWVAIELSAENRKMVYVPEGFAHGFQTLRDDTEVFYQMSQFYVPQHAHGVRWNDLAFEIRWPVDVSVISERDNHYPDFISEKAPNIEYC